MSNTSEQIRSAFLQFFEEKGHEIVPSSPLVPHDDPTLLFINAGMNQFKDVFLGTGTRPYCRAADTQKCLRVSGKHNDLDEVGLDTYHHTLFEMLGNWSFGDYFKREAISWAWELLVDQWGLEPERLYATVHEGDAALGLEADTEAAELWASETTIDPAHVLYCSSKDNFWMMGDTGPCGPCSEIHIDLRSDAERAAVPGHTLVNADDPRVMEIWNLVFIQYNALGNNRLALLEDKHVDTGMGFERVVAVLQGKTSNYDTDLFAGLFETLATLTDREGVHGYNDIRDVSEAEREKIRIAMRVIADHVRAVAFAIADGALPGNEGRGYVIRRILRRAVRYGYQTLGFRAPFLYRLLTPLRQKMAPSFPELETHRGLIEKVVKAEEEGFLRTLATGIAHFEGFAAQAEGGVFPGDAAFQLHDTYGFPIDLTQLMAREEGLAVDMQTYTALMQEQRDRARAASSFKTVQVVASGTDPATPDPTVFEGYTATRVSNARIVQALPVGEGQDASYQIVLDRTPFYAESGGQVGDTGVLLVEGEEIQVLDTQQKDGVFYHTVDRLPATLEAPVDAVVAADRRAVIKKHHTATHLLHKALRELLGTHVTQKGSLVAPDRLRFDFSHFEKVTPEELRAVERRINAAVQANAPADIRTDVPIDEATDLGAMMLFGEKYGDRVRVVKFGDSIELCGGTHVGASGEIGLFRFTSEGSIASGIRRVEAVVGAAAVDLVQRELATLDAVRHQFQGLERPVEEEVADLLAQAKRAEKEVAQLKEQALAASLDAFVSQAKAIDGVRLATGRIDGADMPTLRNLGETLRAKLGAGGVGVLGAADPEAGKVYLVAAVADDVIGKGVQAGQLVGQLARLVGGGGGGRPTLATAGGRQPENLDAALAEAPVVLARLLGEA